MKERVAWILPGGGGRASYTAGAVYAAFKAKIPSPDIIVTASGSAGTAFYYTSGQAEAIKEIWCTLLSTKKFVNIFRFWRILDVNYLVDTVFKKQVPLNIKKIRRSKIKLLIGVTNYDSGRAEFLSNKDNIDLWQTLKATKSAPVFSSILSKQNFIIKNKRYFDTRASSRFEALINKAVSEGASKIIVFDNYNKRSSWTSSKFWSRIWLLSRNKEFRENQTNAEKEMMALKIPRGIKIVHLKPKSPLSMPPWGNNFEDLNRTFKQGYEETLSNKNLIQ